MSLIVIAGPAGVGKGSLVSWILEHDHRFLLSVSATTRAPRPGEVDGVHYQFVSRADFESMITNDQLLEWAVVHGTHYYGTLISELARAEANDQHLLLEIDLQGARQVKKRLPEAISVFVSAPSFEILESRLRNRETETDAEIQTRLETAKAELAAAHEFDFRVINDDLALTGQKIIEIATHQERET